MRFEFVKLLESEMSTNENIVVLLGDLGYGIFDVIREKFPDRCINVGSSEQLMLGMASGIALEGKIPICYSISSFLIYRPFEFIRNYLDHELIPVKLVGSGRDYDYAEAGFTHHSPELRAILGNFENIDQYWPNSKDELHNSVSQFINSKKPAFISLQR
jgi:transketolase